jgi:cytochrome c553
MRHVERPRSAAAGRTPFAALGPLALTAGLALLACVPAQGADIQAGKSLAARCAVCHGPDGMATAPDAPNLAGQNAFYLAKALRDFKTGARKNEMMSMMVKDLSDTDIENLAAYYHDIKINVQAR